MHGLGAQLVAELCGAQAKAAMNTCRKQSGVDTPDLFKDFTRVMVGLVSKWVEKNFRIWMGTFRLTDLSWADNCLLF